MTDEENRKRQKWTRIHFETIGDVVSLLDSEEQRDFLATAFVERLQNTNDAFDETRFRKACAVRTNLEQHKAWRQE